MMNKIVKELETRGYKANVVNVVKNGIELTGITLYKVDETIAPVFYKDDIWDMFSAREIANLIEEMYADLEVPKVNPDDITNPDFLRKHTKLCVQPKGNETGIIKRNYLDLEVYLRCFISDDGSFKVTPEMETEDLFECAVQNTRRDMEISMFGGVMHIATNADKLLGAGCIYCTDMFADFCKANKVKGCFIIPSSIHELILIADDDMSKQGKYNAMVRDANAEVVNDAEYLSDHAYYYSLESNSITW